MVFGSDRHQDFADVLVDFLRSSKLQGRANDQQILDMAEGIHSRTDLYKALVRLEDNPERIEAFLSEAGIISQEDMPRFRAEAARQLEQEVNDRARLLEQGSPGGDHTEESSDRGHSSTYLGNDREQELRENPGGGGWQNFVQDGSLRIDLENGLISITGTSEIEGERLPNTSFRQFDPQSENGLMDTLRSMGMPEKYAKGVIQGGIDNHRAQQEAAARQEESLRATPPAAGQSDAGVPQNLRHDVGMPLPEPQTLRHDIAPDAAPSTSGFQHVNLDIPVSARFAVAEYDGSGVSPNGAGGQRSAPSVSV